MKITYKPQVPKAPPEETYKVGDIFKRKDPSTHGHDIYMIIQSNARAYKLIMINTGVSYSWREHEDINDVFGGFKNTFIQIKEPVELVIG